MNFQEALWIRAEIVQCNVKAGHVYLELVEKDPEGEIVAQGSAVIWKNQVTTISKNLDASLLQLLKPGHECMFKALIDFHIRYGLKLIVQGINQEFAMGQLALQRRKTILQLQGEGLWQRNQACKLPQPIQRIAVIASQTSAGYADFMDQMQHNAYGFAYDIMSLDVSVQGQSAVQSIEQAFIHIEKQWNHWDAVVLIRGGGSKHDLSDFDGYPIAKAISLCKLPVLCGIGHQTDESIADLSAFRSLKTPTAVAEFILQNTLLFDRQFDEVWHTLVSLSSERTRNALQKVNLVEQQLGMRIHRTLSLHKDHLNEQQMLWREMVQRTYQLRSRKLHALELELLTNDPDQLFSKGYTLSTVNGQPVHKLSKIRPGDTLVTLYQGGKLESSIQSIWPKEN